MFFRITCILAIVRKTPAHTQTQTSTHTQVMKFHYIDHWHYSSAHIIHCILWFSIHICTFRVFNTSRKHKTNKTQDRVRIVSFHFSFEPEEIQLKHKTSKKEKKKTIKVRNNRNLDTHKNCVWKPLATKVLIEYMCISLILHSRTAFFFFTMPSILSSTVYNRINYSLTPWPHPLF